MTIRGTVESGYEPVREEFARNFAERGEVGAALCVYVEGRPVVDLQGGVTEAGGTEPYGPRTLQLVASVTKGAMAICAHRLAARGELDLDAPVSQYWPEFAAAGKQRLPVRWLLSHQAGLPAVGEDVTMAEIYAWDPVVAKLAATAPLWEPGTRHGYHAVTYGWLVGEVLSRIAGVSAGQLLRREVAEPLGLDLYVGLPPGEDGRVSRLRPAPPPPPGIPLDDLTARMVDPGSVAHRAYFYGVGLFSSLNEPELWHSELPAVNGMATAHALARMYAACLDGVDGVRLLDGPTLDRAAAEQVRGQDEITGYETAYGLGFQLPFPFRPQAGAGCFGHYGIAGSLGFASRRYGFALGYTVNQMGRSIPADPRSVALVDALLPCLPG